MKKKFLAILLGALMLVSMIPATAMAAGETNILPNSEFESVFASIAGQVGTPLPTDAWLASTQDSVGGHFASFTRVAPAPEDAIQPATAASTAYLKAERHIANETSKSRNSLISYIIPAGTLTAGGTYRLEFYVNIPTALEGTTTAQIFFQRNDGGTLRPAHNYMGPADGWNKNMKSTTGWEKKSFEFTCESTYATNGVQLNIGLNGDSAGVAYFDEIKLYAFVPETILIHSQDFQADGLASTIDSVSSYKVRGGRATLSIENDPTGADNKVMFVTSKNKEAGTLLPMAGEGLPTTQLTYTDYDTIRASFRIFVPTQEVISGGFSLSFEYYNLLSGSGNSGRARPGLSFSASDAGKWLNFEVYMQAFLETTPQLYLITGTSADASAQYYNYYIDDIVVEKINNGAYISDMNVNNSHMGARAHSTGVDGNWMFMTVGEYKASFAKTDVITPVIAFAPGKAGVSGLAFAAVYKNEDNVRTLVDIKATPVGRVIMNELATGDSASTGIACSELSIDLSTLNLSEGDYEVEYFLWNASSFAPLADTKTFSIN